MQKYLEAAGVDFQFHTEVTNVVFERKDGKKVASAIECKVNGVEKGILLTEKDLVFVTNGSCTEGTVYGDHHHAPNGDAEVRTSGCWSLWKNIARQDPAFGHPEKFCSDISKTNWESATITTLDDKIIPYITNICKRDPRSGNVVTGGIVSCKDSKWLMSWTINRQGQFKQQDPEKVCVWVYGLFTDVPGDYIKKPMKDCTGEEITAEWLYHIGENKRRPAGCHSGWLHQFRISRTVCRYAERYRIYDRIFCPYSNGSCLWTARCRPRGTGSVGQCV